MHRIAYLTLLIIVAASACRQPEPVDRSGSREALLATDREAAALAADSGFSYALLAYADSAFVKLNHGEYAVVGKSAFSDHLHGRHGTRDIRWEPRDGEVALSGELGFTWGDWSVREQDSTYYGNYVTVWKRGADGKWRMRLDGGNETPGPPATK